MFYEQNQLDSLLNCPCCTERYDLPLMLPCCWKTICKKCVQKSSNLDQFKCPLCFKNQKHKNSSLTVQQSLPINEALMKLLNLKPVDLIHADLYRKLGDLFKNIQTDLDELSLIEINSQTNLNTFFDTVKTEIISNTKNLIEQANRLKDKLIYDLDYLKENLISKIKQTNSKLIKFKNYCYFKLNEWQTGQPIDNKLDLALKEAELLSNNLKEKNEFLSKTIFNHKLVFNQKYEIKSLLETYIGKLDLDPNLNPTQSIKYLNDLICLDIIKIDDSLKPIFIIPIIFKKLLYVSKLTYDEFSDIKLRIMDTNGVLLHENSDLLKSKINFVQSYSKFICVSLTDYKSGRNMIKLYDTSLCLIKTVILDNQSDFVYMNSDFIYVKVELTYPFMFKYDYNLTKLDLFDKSLLNNLNSDIFVSLNIDKLIYVNNMTNCIYLIDNCFSKVKIYSETNGDLVETINFKNLRDCIIYVSGGFNNIDSVNDNDDNNDDHDDNERIICLNKTDKLLSLYDRKGKLIVENSLDDKIKNINEFYVCQDGSLVFIDNLNDQIYCYSQ